MVELGRDVKLRAQLVAGSEGIPQSAGITAIESSIKLQRIASHADA